MKFPTKFPIKRRLVGACLVALSFIGPMIAAPGVAKATEGELDNDARLEGYGGIKAVLDSGVATSYLLLAGLTVLAGAVMFKDARRIHKKS